MELIQDHLHTPNGRKKLNDGERNMWKLLISQASSYAALSARALELKNEIKRLDRIYNNDFYPDWEEMKGFGVDPLSDKVSAME